jgi:zeaxanthin glucosyltransferase
VSLPVTGHINPMTALARKLNQRGHEAVFFGVPDIGTFGRAAGVTFVPYGEKEFPEGSIPKLYAPLVKLRGLAVAQYAFEKCSPGLTQAASTICRRS